MCTGRTHAKKMLLGLAFTFGVGSNLLWFWDPMCHEPETPKANAESGVEVWGFGTSFQGLPEPLYKTCRVKDA